MPFVIEVRGLSKRFGDFVAVDRIDFAVERGEILGFLGPNGAGKTTTIKLIMGLISATEGTVHIAGLDGERQRREIKRLTGYMSQKSSLYPLLTPLENVELFAGISGVPRAEIARQKTELGRRVAGEHLRLKTSDLPPGVRQSIALFVSLLTDPQVILLDEPTSGVDPGTRRSFWQEIYRLKRLGKTILVTTHNLDEAEYADRILIIDRGRKILEGVPATLLEEHGVPTVEALFKQAIENHVTN